MKYIYFILFFVINIGYSQINIYVSPNGLSSNNGLSITSSVKTIQQAKDIVTNYISPTMANDIIINLLGGDYLIDQPLIFSTNDGGQNNKTITYKAYQNQIVKVSSGKILTNTDWEIYDSSKNIWKLKQSSNLGTLYSRQIYINGVKGIRARSIDNYNLLESANGYFSFCNTNNYFNWNLNTIQKQDLEIVSNNEWVSNRLPIQDKCQSQFNINKTIWDYNHQQQFRCGNKSSWIENAYDLIDLSDEWYIDRSITTGNILYLKTSNNQAPLNVIIPQLESLVIANNVNNLIFDGLTFQYTNWNEPSINLTALNSNKGLALVQADWYYNIQSSTSISGNIISSAIKFYNCNNITFKNNIFENLGAVGLQFLQNCSNNKICSNNFRNICASAITLGFPDAPQTGTDNLISNNLIDNIATEYKGSVGIFVSTAQRTKILNNEIKNFPYSGISIGWGWANLTSWNTGKNLISNNRIDCSTQSLNEMNDTAAIYTLGTQGENNNGSRTRINNNYIINYRKRYGAIYLDQGSSNIEVENNVIELLNTSAFNDNYVNWFVASCSDTHNVYCNNNYFSNQYPFPLNHPVCQTLLPPLSPTNINVSLSNNVILNTSNSLNTNTIKNQSGLQLTSSCQY